MNNLYVVNYSDGSIGNFVYSEKLMPETNVIVKKDKSEYYGIVMLNIQKEFDPNKYDQIIRKASEKDVKRAVEIKNREEKIKDYAKKLAKDLKLKLNVINVVSSFDRSQILINFYSDNRVDFREYAKKLAQKYRTRIELKQVGARDRSQKISGIGPCGQKFCCSRFLNNLDSVSINMAKNQSLALNPSKINGCCNRLMCCLSYEDDTYTEKRKILPSVGDKIKYKGKDEVVKSVLVLEEKVVIYVNRERIELSGEEYSKK